MIIAVLRRPDLWFTALRQLRRSMAPGFWRDWPFIPRPDSAYLRFRSVTMYGDAARRPGGGDVISYLEWCRSVEPLLEP